MEQSLTNALSHQPLTFTGSGLELPSFTDTDVRAFDPLRHLHEFESRFPAELALFKVVGIHPAQETAIINPYTGQDSTESFKNIGEHSISVAYCASKIAGVLEQAGVITNPERNWIMRRALVHDLTKPYEIMRRDAKRAGVAEDVYSVSAYEKLKPLLVELGVAEDLARYLVEAGKETGHNSLKDFIVSSPDGLTGLVPGRIAEKIVHLADDMTFSSMPRNGAKTFTAFLTCWERMLASQFLEKYPFLWKEGLGQATNGDIKPVHDVHNVEAGIVLIGTYADLQVRVANAIAAEIKKLLQPASDLPPEHFVRSIANSSSPKIFSEKS